MPPNPLSGMCLWRSKQFLGANSFKIERYVPATLNFTFENEDLNAPSQSEDVSESVDNYEDNEFDESSYEEVGLNFKRRRLETAYSSETGYPSRTSFPSLV